MKKFFIILMASMLGVAFLAGTAGALPLLFAPIVPVSEPVAMIFLGSGLISLATAGRKKFLKRD
jgi:hypothetical protein